MDGARAGKSRNKAGTMFQIPVGVLRESLFDYSFLSCLLSKKVIV